MPNVGESFSVLHTGRALRAGAALEAEVVVEGVEHQGVLRAAGQLREAVDERLMQVALALVDLGVYCPTKVRLRWHPDGGGGGR